MRIEDWEFYFPLLQMDEKANALNSSFNILLDTSKATRATCWWSTRRRRSWRSTSTTTPTWSFRWRPRSSCALSQTRRRRLSLGEQPVRGFWIIYILGNAVLIPLMFYFNMNTANFNFLGHRNVVRGKVVRGTLDRGQDFGANGLYVCCWIHERLISRTSRMFWQTCSILEALY